MCIDVRTHAQRRNNRRYSLLGPYYQIVLHQPATTGSKKKRRSKPTQNKSKRMSSKLDLLSFNLIDLGVQQ